MPVTIKLYGGLRQYADETSVSVEVDLPQAEEVVKKALVTALKEGADELVSQCVLATEDKILSSGDMVAEGQALSALPPVCGG